MRPLAGLAIAGSAAALLFYRPPLPSAPVSMARAAPPAASAPAPATPGTAVPASTALPGASSSALWSDGAASAFRDAAPSAPAAATSDGGACWMPLFAPGTFAEPPARMAELCSITDPRKGSDAMRAEVILGAAGKLVSDGMREWAVLGWYEMAAFAIVRASCCPAAPPLHPVVEIATCDIETPLNRLAAVAPSASADDAEVAAAVKEYTMAAKCVARAGGADSFNRKGGPQGGEDTTFKKTLGRVRAAAKKE